MASPFRFVVVTNKGAIPFEANNVSLKKDADGLVSWTASSTQGGIRFENQASMEYDGYVESCLFVALHGKCGFLSLEQYRLSGDLLLLPE